MAILRDSSPVQIDRGSAPQTVGATGVNFVRPDPGKFLKEESAADGLINAILPTAQKLVDTKINVELEEAYLSGVAQASKVESEADLESSPLTADWTTAGYRDTQGRLKMAGFLATVSAKLPSIVTQPDAQAQYDAMMAEERTKIVASLQGMSRKQRAAGFAQHATDTVAAQKQFTKLRAQWIIDQQTQSITSAFSARRNRLDDSKTDPEQYLAESRSFTAAVYKDIWQNPNLTPDLQQSLTKQAIQYAASTDNTAVYEMLKRDEFTFGDGTSGTIMSRLSFEDQVALDKSHREAVSRTKTIRSSSFETAMAKQQAEWEDPDGPGPTISYEQLRGQLDEARDNGILSAERYGSIQRSYWKAVGRNGGDGTLANLYASGDFAAIVKTGHSQEDGVKAYMKAQAGRPITEVVPALLAIGHNSGMDTAYDKVGELTAPTFAQLGFAAEISPEGAIVAHQLVEALDIAEQTNPGVYARTMKALNSEGQDMMLYMREAQRNGISDPLTAVQYARDQRLKAQQLGPLANTMMREANKVDAVAVQEIGDRQLLGTISGGFKSWFSADAETRQRLSTGRMWFEDPDRTAFVRAEAQQALSEELFIIARTNPSLSAESRMSKALANMSARTIDTDSGPLVIPRGQNIHKFFGAPQYADQAYIGKAVNDIVPTEDGQRIAWSPTPDNKLIFRKFNEDGSVVESGIIDPKSIGVKVQENLDKDAKTAAGEIGPGVVMGSGNSTVQFNGTNTEGVQPKNMLGLRAEIVKLEGVTDTSYNDGKVIPGNKSFGVGISQSGAFYQEPLGRDGKYTQGQINDSFMKASNAAAGTAIRSMARTASEGPDWLNFFGVLAYQSPKAAQDSNLLANIRVGDKSGAINALRATDAFKNSPPERQAEYIRKLNKAMK